MVRDHCLCLHTQRAARVLARRFDDALRPFGLTNGQFSLLVSLSRPEPPPMGPVASLLAMDRTTLTAALKPLERRGLLKVKKDPSDRRSRILVLTDEGRTLLASAVPIWKKTHDAMERDAPDIDWDLLRKSLREISYQRLPEGTQENSPKVESAQRIELWDSESTKAALP